MGRKIKAAGLVLLAVFGGLLLWGVGVEPRLIEENRYEVRIPDLPPAWEGKEVAFIADLQLGMFLDNDRTIRRMVERIIEEKPAAVLIGGDFVYHPTEDDAISEAKEEFEAEDEQKLLDLIRQIADILGPLADSGSPVFAVLGNHDYAMPTRNAWKLAWVAEELSRALETIGIPVLKNEARPLPSPGEAQTEGGAPLYLVGIGPEYPGEADVDKAFAALPPGASRLVMMHNPQPFGRIPAGAAPLAVAGHTHGGQVRVPYLESWSWLSIVQEGEVHADGWIKDFGAPGNRLYVNRGIGFSRVPVRINCRPELTWFTLRE